MLPGRPRCLARSPEQLVLASAAAPRHHTDDQFSSAERCVLELEASGLPG